MEAFNLIIEKTENLKMQHRIMIFIGSILCVISAFVFFIYNPRAEKISILQKEVKRLEQQIDDAKAKAARLPELEAREEKTDSQFKKALKFLPDKKEIPVLLKQINRLGEKSGLVFRLFQPQKERPKGFYYEIPIAIEVDGNFNNVLSFISRITSMERIVNVFDVSMAPVKPFSTDLKTTFTAVTYRFIPKNEKEVRAKRKNRKR